MRGDRIYLHAILAASMKRMLGRGALFALPFILLTMFVGIVDPFDCLGFSNLVSDEVKSILTGRKLFVDEKNGTSTTSPFLWNKDNGFFSFRINNYYSYKFQIIDFNDIGYYIGYYTQNNTERPYLYKYNKSENRLIDLGIYSEFSLSAQLEKIGYHPTDIWLSSINNKGQIAGLFSYGHYDQYKKKYIAVGEEAFFCDGKIMNIIPLPQAPTKGAFVKLNNVGSLLVYLHDKKTTYFWNERCGIHSIPGFIGSRINDSDVIIGEGEDKTPLIWKEGEVLNLSEMFGWDVSKSYGINKFIDINNKSQLLCTNPSNVVYIIEPINSTTPE